MSKPYTFHSDAGHGWMEVSLMELIKLGIANQISSFSYKKGMNVYLEEDDDAAKFLNAKKKIGEEVEIVEVYKADSPIRSYQSYT